MRLREFQLFFVLAIVCSFAAPQAFAQVELCERQLVKEIWHSDSERSRAELLENHVRFDSGAGHYEVLLPQKNGSFRLIYVQTEREARRISETIEEPLDIDGAIELHRQAHQRLLELIRPTVDSFSGARLSGRIKDRESLKTKLFDKARTRGRDFRIQELDDIVGARIAAPSNSEVEAIAQKLRLIPDVEVVKFDRVDYLRGYRAIHVTLREPKGPALEVQVMTKNMAAWTLWNAKRVYKPRNNKDVTYLSHLKDYDRALVNYIHELDDHPGSGPRIPNYQTFHLRPEDAFILEESP